MSLQGAITPDQHSNHQDKDNYIFRKNHITLSTTKGAKGYDAYIVFLLGADLFPATSEGRASFYVGVTRSKLGIYISGILKEFNLLHESLKIKEVLNTK